MADFFLGEVRVFPFPFAPRNWALCNGAILPIGQNQALFSLYGIAFGGDGRATFALPDLRGRVPVHHSLPALQQGNAGGLENVALQLPNMPAHTHQAAAGAATANSASGLNKVLAPAVSQTGSPVPTYGASAGHTQTLATDTLSIAGGNVPHNNMQPFAVVNFCVAMSGIYPSRP